MQESHTAFATGEHVRVRDERWVIVRADAFDTVRIVRLRGIGDRNHGALQTFISPCDRVEPEGSGTSIRQRGRRATLAVAAGALAHASRWDDCWTTCSSNIDIRTWQLEPAAAAVRGTTRLLLADPVGMGKTIQAGVLVAELCARGLASRILILTPASIRQQWATELRDRFALSPRVFDHASLAAATATAPAGANPWQMASLVVSSIDLVKRPEVRAALEALTFDVLIVDEAHHLTPGSDRAAAVAELAARSVWVVLATATPHSGDEAAYAFLQRLGAVGDRPMRVFRREARHAADLLPRRSRLLLVRPTPEERALLDETLAYTRALAARRAAPGARLVASLIARRAASSAEAARRSLARRLALLTSSTRLERQVRLPWDEEDADDVSDAALAAPGLDNPAVEREWLLRLTALAERAVVRPSKVDVLRRLLRRTRESVLVFSEYRDVVLVLAASIEDVADVAVLHGGLSARERHAVVRDFQTGRVRALVATDAAGEGLNLHQHCRVVLNAELPWAPLRLEQRIGRVDRMGQTRRVHAIHLAHRDSFEGTVIARLERRRGRAAIRATSAPISEGDDPAAVARRLHRAAARYGSSREGASYASRVRGRAPKICLLYIVTIYAADGRAVQRSAVPLAVSLHPGIRHLTRSTLRRICADGQVQAILTKESEQLLAAAGERTRTAAASIADRLAAMALQLDARSGARWQGSLFDRRAEQQARARGASIDAVRHQFTRRSATCIAFTTLRAGRPRLVAAWCR